MQLHLPPDLTDMPNAAVIARLASAWNPLEFQGSLSLISYTGKHGHLLVFDGISAEKKEMSCSTVIPDDVMRSSARSKDVARLFRQFVDYVEECLYWGYLVSWKEATSSEAVVA